jgi:protein phosphatase
VKIVLPELSLVVLVGASGSGKSSFARRHFGPFEIASSDFCRGMVSNDENNLGVSKEAFELLYAILRHRLSLGRLTVVDATNVRPEDRRGLVQVAREHHVLPVAVVFDIPEEVCQERNRRRADRDFGPHVIRNQRSAMRRGLRGLKREGFRHVFTFKTVEEVDAATIERQPLWNNKKEEQGPFDIIGDVHGCFDELTELLERLGYAVNAAAPRPDGLPYTGTPPAGRMAVFLGDLVDRGPRIADTLKLVMAMVADGAAYCVPGNHDIKLLRKLHGKNVQITHGLDQSIEQLERESGEFRESVAKFIDSLVSHYVFDQGRLVVAHAGLKESMQGRGSGKVREFCLYGETTGETDEFGLPVRWDWASEYKGQAMVVYGHTPVPEPEWLNHTLNIDTGCVFGGRLTALRYSEKELVSVPALRTYAEPARPFLEEDHAPAAVSAQHAVDDLLDLADVFGKRIIGTRLLRNVTIRQENAAAALEVMSRFAANPKWLIYLPPTMSPCETSRRPDFLEYPEEAFTYYRNLGAPQVVCQRKHMGSRAVVVVCRDEQTARDRFGVVDEGIGIIHTRTGRRFFEDAHLEQILLQRVRDAAGRAGLWEELSTDWICLDCELMPWSAKARELLRGQYAAVGAAGRTALAAAVSDLERAAARTGAALPLLEDFKVRRENIERYTAAYRQYCWPVGSPDDFRLAPFHLLATEGAAHFDKDHLWHMEWSRRLGEADGLVLIPTEHRIVELTDDASSAEGTQWWLELTEQGGEGMVVKPMDFIARGPRELVQPAVKCRGREYLRIIYGPQYTSPEHLDRLRSRGLSRKRGLAVREFALGVEALERFIRREPLRRVHECVFGVLSLESEPVDPRL